MSTITSISLTPEAARLAQRMKREGKNFSKFVRECLHLYYRESSENEHFGQTETWEGCEPFCIPTRSHFCRVCWPVGTPDISALADARKHVRVLGELRNSGEGTHPKWGGELDDDMLIPALWQDLGHGRKDIQLEPAVLQWLKDQADEHNRFLMPLANLDLTGNEKPVKAEKPRKGLLKRILYEMGK